MIYFIINQQYTHKSIIQQGCGASEMFSPVNNYFLSFLALLFHS